MTDRWTSKPPQGDPRDPGVLTPKPARRSLASSGGTGGASSGAVRRDAASANDRARSQAGYKKTVNSGVHRSSSSDRIPNKRPGMNNFAVRRLHGRAALDRLNGNSWYTRASRRGCREECRIGPGRERAGRLLPLPIRPWGIGIPRIPPVSATAPRSRRPTRDPIFAPRSPASWPR